MYLPPGAYGLSSIVYELVGNSIDEFLRGNASEVQVRFEEGAVEVFDDGLGLPFDEPSEGAASRVEDFLTTPHFTRSASGHAPHVHLEQRGVGLAVINALSAEVEITSVRSGKAWQQVFRQGSAVGTAKNINAPFQRGTRVRVVVDREIFEDRFQFDTRAIRAKLFEAAHLFPGLVLGTDSERFRSENGLGDLAAMRSSYKPFGSSIDAFNADVEDVQIQFAAIRPLGQSDPSCEILSWANGSRTTEHGDHVSGVRDIVAEQGWWPSTILIHVVMQSPEFAGPTRGRLNAPHVRDLVARAIRKHMAETS